jgi:putative flippase GtrA
MSTFRRHLLDISGSTAASLAATGCDGIVYALLVHTLVGWKMLSLGVSAGLAAIVGGVIHYILCRFWVFRRFDASLRWSAVTYFVMSGLAAVGHGFLTEWLAGFIGAGFGWALSKAILWALWTYPASRYVVFGGMAGQQPDEEALDADPN